MKNFLFLFFLFTFSINAQVNTEVHVFNIESENQNYKLVNGKNISNNFGYDNQPYFYNTNQLLFSSNKNGQTEIVFYDLKTQEKKLISNTKNGSEYSPQRIPNSKHISAVRLDNDGLQRFYKYNFRNQKSKEIIADLKVAYPFWFDKNNVIAVTIVNNNLELIICDLKEKKNSSVTKNVGRSVHKIPNTNLVSFISKQNKDNWTIKSLNPITKEIKVITSLGKTEDVCWLPNGTLLFSQQNAIYKFNPEKDKQPTLFHQFLDENINNISRITVNNEGTKIALVAEVSPVYLAQQQLDAYNKRDIETFLKVYSKDVKVYRFPNKLEYTGIEKMRAHYQPFFENTPDLHCKLLNRVVFENKIIDHELVTINGREFKAVAIYETKGGKITSVTFM